MAVKVFSEKLQPPYPTFLTVLDFELFFYGAGRLMKLLVVIDEFKICCASLTNVACSPKTVPIKVRV